MSLTHIAKSHGRKWSLGRAICGCTLGMWTPTSGDRSEVTCPRCLKRSDPDRKMTAKELADAADSHGL